MPRTKATKLDKRLRDDLAKAERAIAMLEVNAANPPMDMTTVAVLIPRFVNGKRVEGRFDSQPSALTAFLAAIESELTRMRTALTDHRLLWSIYRRADKKAPYYVVATEAEVAA